MSASWAWLTLAIIIGVFVAIFDITHSHTMSAQMHDWLVNRTIGPIVIGAGIGTFIGLAVHFVENKP